MKLIAITLESIVSKETTGISRLFDEGLEVLHLRKPETSSEALKNWLEEIDPVWHNRIVLHDHFSIVDIFALKGVHLNKRNTEIPEKEGITVSRSCHSLKEVAEASHLDYCFLSPIFNSISKKGYQKGFGEEELIKARETGVIHSGVMALGGITPDNTKTVAYYGFGGTVVLGSLWMDFAATQDIESLLERFRILKKESENVTL